MERKAAHSRRRNQRRSEYPGRSAIHVCNTTRCDSVCFHSLVPVFDMSDPLKRSAGQLRPRPRSRSVQICKERTMLHSARPRGRMQGHRRGSRIGKKRECFGTETRNMTRPGAAPAGIGGVASEPPPIDLQSPDGGGARMAGRVRLALHASRGPSPHHRRSIPDACLTQKTGWRSTTARCSTARPRQPRIATRGVPPRPRAARHDAADRPVREVIEELAEHVLPVFHDGQA